MSIFNKKKDKTLETTNMLNHDILIHAVESMIDNADAEAAIEGKTVKTAAISDSGMILRF